MRSCPPPCRLGTESRAPPEEPGRFSSPTPRAAALGPGLNVLQCARSRANAAQALGNASHRACFVICQACARVRRPVSVCVCVCGCGCGCGYLRAAPGRAERKLRAHANESP
ncbi:hypothetical protein BD413DRAFT_554652 [Trametes elegans]|nr:hypothetical protein BD413DRAFT_554652 [Trametes elegans]